MRTNSSTFFAILSTRKIREDSHFKGHKGLSLYLVFILFLLNPEKQGFDTAFRVELAQRRTGKADTPKQGRRVQASGPNQELERRREHEQLELDLQPQEPGAPHVVVETLEQQMKIVPLGGRHVGDVQTGAAGSMMP